MHHLTSTTLALFLLLSLLKPAIAWSDPYGPIASGYFSIVMSSAVDINLGTQSATIYGENQQPSPYALNCPSYWNALDSWLPWVVSVHTSEQFCELTNADNLWIAYANQWLNIPTDTRCGPVEEDNFYTKYRCIIAINP